MAHRWQWKAICLPLRQPSQRMPSIQPGSGIVFSAVIGPDEILMLPKVGDDFTVDPASYPYVHAGLGAASGDTFTVNGLSGSIYIIGYVVLNSEEDTIAR